MPGHLCVYVVQELAVAQGAHKAVKVTDHGARVLGAFGSLESAELYEAKYAAAEGLVAHGDGGFLRKGHDATKLFKLSVSKHEVLGQRHETRLLQLSPNAAIHPRYDDEAPPREAVDEAAIRATLERKAGERRRATAVEDGGVDVAHEERLLAADEAAAAAADGDDDDDDDEAPY